MVSRMNKTGHFFIFSPVHDLSAIARGGEGADGLAKVSTTSMFRKGRFRDLAGTADVVGDEWAHQIIRVSSARSRPRKGAILFTSEWFSVESIGYHLEIRHDLEERSMARFG